MIFSLKMSSKINRFSKNKNYRCLLSNCKNKLRKAIVSNSNREQIFSVCECVLNVSNGNVKLNKEDFVKLKKYKKYFKRLLDKKRSLQEKKKLLIQRGGFLQFLIPAVISGISSIVAAAISKPTEN